MKHLLHIFLFFLSSNLLLAQSVVESNVDPKKEEKPQASPYFGFELSTSIDKPFADMAKRFGINNTLGLGLIKKTNKNIIYTINASLIFGRTINDDSVLHNVLTSENGIISNLGEVLNVGIFERGYHTGITVSKVFPINKKRIDNGIMASIGTGFIQHKIKYVDQDNQFPQLAKQYRKGYDRLTNGSYFETFVGYRYHSKNKLLNFYSGIDMLYAITKNRRDYTYDIILQENKTRNDILLGFKFGFIVPIYKKNVEEKYF